MKRIFAILLIVVALAGVGLLHYKLIQLEPSVSDTEAIQLVGEIANFNANDLANN